MASARRPLSNLNSLGIKQAVNVIDAEAIDDAFFDHRRISA